MKKPAHCTIRKPLANLSQLILILGIAFFLFNAAPIQAKGRKAPKGQIEAQKSQTAENKSESEKAAKLTVWKIIEMTDWLFWPFVLIIATGIMLIIYRGLYEYREKSRSQSLMQGKIRLNDLKQLIRMNRGPNPTRAWRLFHQMLVTFDKTRKAEPIGDDVNQFLNTERDSFESFNRITSFLSDTAGALGLLGTVWGIFQTFHAGKLDGPTILQGMSISLVTTLVGLIISVALNMGSTYIFTIFNGQLNVLSTRAEAVRQILLAHETKGTKPQPAPVEESDYDIQTVEMNYQPRPKARAKRNMDVAYQSNY